MDKIITRDGSETLRNIEFDETYHSTTGALEETYKKFIEPCKISEKSKKGIIRVLDICFGLGYNAIAAVDTALSNNSEIEIISLEKDLFLDELKKLNVPLKNYNIIKKLEYDPITDSYLYEEKNIHLKIIIGDAKKTIDKVHGKFDAVLFDPFSPKKNPLMWTSEFFSKIKLKMYDDAILSTYSCARVVRDNLKIAGFNVFDGPKVGRRGPSTIATKNLLNL